MTQIIFSDETSRGWMPPTIAAPFIRIFPIAINLLPSVFGLQYLGFTGGNPHTAAGGVGVAGSNPVVPTNFFPQNFGNFRLQPAERARLRFSLSYS
jgi:hypothetical protein